MATQDPTTNYSWDLPTIDGSNNTWGEELNAIIGDDSTGIDAVVKAVSDVANAALPKAAGTSNPVTGELVIGTGGVISEIPVNLASGTEIDWSDGNFFYRTISGSTTFTFANTPQTRNDGVVQFIVIQLTNASTNVSWPATVKWQDGVAPTFTASGIDVVVMYNRDGDSNVYAAHAISDPS